VLELSRGLVFELTQPNHPQLTVGCNRVGVGCRWTILQIVHGKNLMRNDDARD